MTNWMQQLRLAARSLANRPGFTAVVVGSLALAVGANTAVFSLVNAVLLRDLPYREPEKIVIVYNQFPATEQMKDGFSVVEFDDLRERAQAFEEVAGTRPGLANLTGDGEPELLVTVRTSANLFRLLGVRPALGRDFLPEEETAGKERVVILSHGLWARRFGQRPSILGEKLTIDGLPHEVIGVLPKDFHFRRKGRDLWIPAVIDRGAPRDDRWFEVYGRIKPGVSFEKATADVKAVAVAFSQDHPDLYSKSSGYTMGLTSYREEIVGSIRTALVVVGAAVGLVLLIACANVANLLLARATTREREVALRAALGASRGNLLSQFLAEGMLLAAGGAALGFLLAWWSVRAVARMNPGRIPRVDEVAIDGLSLAFTLAVMLATGLFFGLVPALRAGKEDFAAVLKEGGKGSAGVFNNFARRLLVVVEVAVALWVLVGASLLGASLRQLQQVKPGFDPDGLLTLELRLPRAKYAQPEQAVSFFDQLLARLNTLPGVTGSAAINAIPLGVVERTGDLEIEGKPAPPGEAALSAAWRFTSPGYFKTMDVPLLSGREFGSLDLADGQLVAIVDQSFAERSWPGESPLGKRLRLVGQGVPDSWRSVVGVAGNVKHDKLETPARETVYVPYPQFPQWFMYLGVRTTGDAAAMAEPVRRAVREVDPDQAIFRVETMEQKLTTLLGWRRFYTLLLGAFAAVALTLAIVGVYSLMAYQAAQRTREIGIRMALGAQPGSVLKLVLRQGLALAGAGVAIGLAVALGSVRIVSSLLYGVSALNLPAFLLVALGILGLAMLASYLPARRATKVDPKVALGTE